MTHNLAISAETSLSAEVAYFRAQIFPNVYLAGQFDEIENVIDASSLHITMRFWSEVVGYARITDGRFHVFTYFTDGQAPLPTTSDTWSLGRGGIAKEWRNAELLTLVVIESIVQCRMRGAKHIVGAVPPTEKALATIRRSLMLPIGPVVRSGHHNQRVPHQPVIHTSAGFCDKDVLECQKMASDRSALLMAQRAEKQADCSGNNG